MEYTSYFQDTQKRGHGSIFVSDGVKFTPLETSIVSSVVLEVAV